MLPEAATQRFDDPMSQHFQVGSAQLFLVMGDRPWQISEFLALSAQGLMSSFSKSVVDDVPLNSSM
jgi:hypothetical protein